MDYNDIEQLLERYWQCDTSTEEEARLRDFFTQEEVPAHLLRYKSLFEFQKGQQQVQVSDDFDARLMARIKATEPVVVKARRVSSSVRLTPLLKAAAVIAIVVGLGNLMQRSFFADNGQEIVPDTIGEQITTPSVALSQEAANASEKQLSDSIPHAELPPTEKVTTK